MPTRGGRDWLRSEIGVELGFVVDKRSTCSHSQVAKWSLLALAAAWSVWSKRARGQPPIVRADADSVSSASTFTDVEEDGSY